MKKFLLILTIALTFATVFQPSASPVSSPGKADYLWRQLCAEIDPDCLVREKETCLIKRNASFDPDNNCYYIEFPATTTERTLASITFAGKNLIKIRIFPPLALQSPYFAGFIRIQPEKNLFRGCVSDYSDHVCGYLTPELL